MRINDLQRKSIVNISEGRVIGFLVDIEFDFSSKTITGIVIEQSYDSRKWFRRFNGENELIIPIYQVVSIGEDVILVNYGN